MELAWAGRVKGTGTVEVGWEAAESARDALTTLSLLSADRIDRFDLIAAAWNALRGIDHRDLSALLVASDADGVSLAACGLSMIHAGEREIAPTDHPIFGEVGIPERTGFFLCEPGELSFRGTPVSA